ncbi:hypothetical protein EsH8_III_001307 [Colletotrichum jinshuiense]
MAETVMGAVGLIGDTVTIIQQIQQARNRVKGASKTLEDVSSMLHDVPKTLDFVSHEPQLQTAEVEAQIEGMKKVLLDLKSFLIKLQENQQKGKMRNFIHALTSGDADDKHLASVLDQLQTTRGELLTRISVVNVGLSGNLQDGFKVALKVLQDTNVRVRQVLGIHLSFAERLRDRELQLVGPGIILLETSDVVDLGLDRVPTPFVARHSSKSNGPENQSENLKWHHNNVGSNATFHVGNLGIEDDSKLKEISSSITNSTFGNDLRFVHGNIGGEAASIFVENLFKK